MGPSLPDQLFALAETDPLMQEISMWLRPSTINQFLSALAEQAAALGEGREGKATLPSAR